VTQFSPPKWWTTKEFIEFIGIDFSAKNLCNPAFGGALPLSKAKDY
jgi:hypothetical protein